MNKRELYESIMRNVAKEVKKALYEIDEHEIELEEFAKDNGYDFNIYGAIVGSNNMKHSTWIGIKWNDFRHNNAYSFHVINRTVNKTYEEPILAIPAEARKLWKSAEQEEFTNLDIAHKKALLYIKKFNDILL